MQSPLTMIIDDRSAHRRSHGFTLLELMVTVLVLGVLLGAGVPAFFETIRSNRATADTNELVTALSIARSEAVRRGARITLCGSSNGTSCDGAWGQRWMLFVDSAATDDAAPSAIATGDTLGEWGAPVGNTAIAMQRANGAAATVNWIRFLPRGEVRTHNNVLPLVVHIEVDGCSNMQARDVELNAVGRTTVERAAC